MEKSIKIEEGNNLKCYFAFSNDIEKNQTYKDMLVCTLASARKNTTLDLHCLYDGSESDELYLILKQFNVKVKIASIPFLDDLKKIYTHDYMQEKFGYQISDASLRSRFLRMIIPNFENDKYILYCDTDVMFMRDIKLCDFDKLPEYIGVCPEFNKSQDYTYFNAGIMLMNVDNARIKLAEFLDMINNKRCAKIECCDQGYLNDLYEGIFDKLPLEYNWKPQWGVGNPYIVHFHGVKPFSYSPWGFNFCRDCIRTFNDAKIGFLYYYFLYASFLQRDFDIDFKNMLTYFKLIELSNQKKWKLSIFLLYSFNRIIFKNNLKFLYKIAERIRLKLNKIGVYIGTYDEFENAKTRVDEE